MTKWILLLLVSLPLYAEQIIYRDYYSLSYNEDHEVANWVSYTMASEQMRNCVKRSNSFRIDPNITTGSSSPNDYKNSGLDKGHLLPAGDMKFKSSAMKDTFYMSNITPQPPRFNRGQWGQLEVLVRAWVIEYEKLWITTGPVLEEGLPTIGHQNTISIPNSYFKVLLKQVGKSYKGIGFIMETHVPYTDLKSYVVSIDEIEEITGINFFEFLTPKEEAEAESDVDIKTWDFKTRFSYLPCST